MPVSRQQAVANARKVTSYASGMCAKFTREQFGVAALGDFDGDGDADAVDMWQACVLKVHDDRNPPAGVPVFWSGGSKGHGHAAVSLGGGRVRSTDMPSAGRVGDTTIDSIVRAWGMPYLGWTIDLYGHEIPDENAIPEPSPKDILRAEMEALIADMIGKAKGVRNRAKSPSRPRVRSQAGSLVKRLRRLRETNRG